MRDDRQVGACIRGCRSGVNKSADDTCGSLTPRISEALRSLGPSGAGLVWLGEAHSLSCKEENQKLSGGSAFPMCPLFPSGRSAPLGRAVSLGPDAAPGHAPELLGVCVSERLLPGCSVQFKDGHPTSGATGGSSGGCRGEVFSEAVSLVHRVVYQM